tara:strand:+ start:44 stop:1015 length:972 start_codon:yes stop_codon:yes gene_type:complete
MRTTGSDTTKVSKVTKPTSPPPRTRTQPQRTQPQRTQPTKTTPTPPQKVQRRHVVNRHTSQSVQSSTPPPQQQTPGYGAQSATPQTNGVQKIASYTEPYDHEGNFDVGRYQEQRSGTPQHTPRSDTIEYHDIKHSKRQLQYEKAQAAKRREPQPIAVRYAQKPVENKVQERGFRQLKAETSRVDFALGIKKVPPSDPEMVQFSKFTKTPTSSYKVRDGTYFRYESKYDKTKHKRQKDVVGFGTRYQSDKTQHHRKKAFVIAAWKDIFKPIEWQPLTKEQRKEKSDEVAYGVSLKDAHMKINQKRKTPGADASFRDWYIPDTTL